MEWVNIPPTEALSEDVISLSMVAENLAYWGYTKLSSKIVVTLVSVGTPARQVSGGAEGLKGGDVLPSRGSDVQRPKQLSVTDRSPLLWKALESQT